MKIQDVYPKLFYLLPDYSLKLKLWDTVKKKEPKEGAFSLFRVSYSLVSWQRTTDKHKRMPSNDNFKQSFLIPQELSKNSLFDPGEKIILKRDLHFLVPRSM